MLKVVMDIIDEVKQELSEENLHKLIKKYTPLALGMMVAVIIGITAGLWWNGYKADKIHKDGGDYMTALLKMKTYQPEEAIPIFEGFSSNNTPYGMLASLNIAGFKYFKKEYIEAQKWYSEVADNSSNPNSFRDLAELMKVKAMIANNANTQNTIDALTKFTNKNAAFQYSALELLAAAFFSKGDLANMEKTLNKIITDPSAPNTIKERAQQLVVLSAKE